MTLRSHKPAALTFYWIPVVVGVHLHQTFSMCAVLAHCTDASLQSDTITERKDQTPPKCAYLISVLIVNTCFTEKYVISIRVMCQRNLLRFIPVVNLEVWQKLKPKKCLRNLNTEALTVLNILRRKLVKNQACLKRLTRFPSNLSWYCLLTQTEHAELAEGERIYLTRCSSLRLGFNTVGAFGTSSPTWKKYREEQKDRRCQNSSMLLGCRVT